MSPMTWGAKKEGTTSPPDVFKGARGKSQVGKRGSRGLKKKDLASPGPGSSEGKKLPCQAAWKGGALFSHFLVSEDVLRAGRKGVFLGKGRKSFFSGRSILLTSETPTRKKKRARWTKVNEGKTRCLRSQSRSTTSGDGKGESPRRNSPSGRGLTTYSEEADSRTPFPSYPSGIAGESAPDQKILVTRWGQGPGGKREKWGLLYGLRGNFPVEEEKEASSVSHRGEVKSVVRGGISLMQEVFKASSSR